MGQRVNIQYSVDMDELPQEVSSLINKAQAAIEELSRANNWDIDFLSITTVDKINEMRKHMTNIDYILNDVTQIINGYIHYKSQPPEAPPQPAISIDDFEEKLKAFKQSLADQEPDEVSD